MRKRNQPLLQLLLAILGVFVAVFGVRMFNKYLLMQFSLAPRMVLMLATQWLLFLVPAVLMIANKEKLSGFGFTKSNLPKQILLGAALAVPMSALFTVLPIALGLKSMVGSTTMTHAWQFAYEFVYAITGVALAEELVFRGYVFHKLLEIKNAKWFAVVVSSVLFGLFHVFGGNVVQLFVTTAIGFVYCIYREKVRGVTIVSLIVAHGMYDAMIVLWVALL